MSNPLLAGIRVLDLSRLLPGPFCTLYLAQMGAEVIKIEEPGVGDQARGVEELFALVNRGKKSVALNLRNAHDVKQFLRLADTADVVIESFRPGVMDKLGCGYAVLSQRNPKLVYAALTGYGQTGPYRDWPGHDMNYLAISGALDQIGSAGGPPSLSNLQIADLAAGALTCAVGILAAVIGARASGRGSFVDASITDAALALQPVALSSLRKYGRAPKRGEGILSGGLPNYNVYRCRDGKHLAVGAMEPKFFMNLLRILGEDVPAPLRALMPRKSERGSASGSESKAGSQDPFGKLDRWIGDPRRTRLLTTPVRLALAAVFRTRTRDEWARRLQDRDTCVTPVLTPEEALSNEHLRSRGMIEDVDGKPGFALPLLFSGLRPEVGPAPALGADTAKLLGRLEVSHAANR